MVASSEEIASKNESNKRRALACLLPEKIHSRNELVSRVAFAFVHQQKAMGGSLRGGIFLTVTKHRAKSGLFSVCFYLRQTKWPFSSTFLTFLRRISTARRTISLKTVAFAVKLCLRALSKFIAR